MHQTAFEFPSEADEFVEVGLEKAPSLVVRPPRVSGAPISMECRVYKIIPVGEIGDHMIIGEVLRSIYATIFTWNGVESTLPPYSRWGA